MSKVQSGAAWAPTQSYETPGSFELARAIESRLPADARLIVLPFRPIHPRGIRSQSVKGLDTARQLEAVSSGG